MNVREITGPGELEGLREEWWQLWDRCPQATPFQSPGWILPWWRNLFRGGRIRTLELRVEGRLAGLAPFFQYGAPHPRHLVLAGAGITDYLDILIDPEWAAEGAQAVWEWISATAPDRDDFDFQELREDSPLLARGAPRPEECGRCPILELPATWEELMTRIPPKLRTDLRRARNRLARAGNLRVECNREELMCELFRLHAARWRERDEPGVTADAALQKHYREAAAEFLARGMLRLYGLYLDEVCAAVFFGFAARGRTYAYLDGFDPTLARLSPGSVLLSMAIERAIGEGMREFDFLRKREQFKYQWGALDRINYRIRGAP